MKKTNNFVEQDLSTEKSFDLRRVITNDIPEIDQRLKNIGFFVYYDIPTYKKVIKFLREHYGFVCNWEYNEIGDYGSPAWLYQVYNPSKDGKDAKYAWSIEDTENIFDWKKFYKEHPDLDDNEEWKVIISAIDEMITRVENEKKSLYESIMHEIAKIVK